MFTEQEEMILKKWLAWQKQASLTNDVSFQMEARIKELGKPTAEDLAKDATFQNLKAQHDTEAEKCEPLMKSFKAEVKL
jgi:hypothetical protein